MRSYFGCYIATVGVIECPDIRRIIDGYPGIPHDITAATVGTYLNGFHTSSSGTSTSSPSFEAFCVFIACSFRVAHRQLLGS